MVPISIADVVSAFSTASAVPFAGPRARLVAQRTPPVLEKDRNNPKKTSAGSPPDYVRLRDNHAETTFQIKKLSILFNG